MTDDTLTPGDPALGGETNAGHPSEWPEGHDRPLDVGSYDPTTPWGLQDASGGTREWTETWNGPVHSGRIVMGTDSYDPDAHFFPDPLAQDTIRQFRLGSISDPIIGFRFASIVPAPGAIGAIFCFAIGGAQRRRRRDGAYSA